MMIRPTRSRGVTATTIAAVGAVLALPTLVAAPVHAATGPLGDLLIDGSASGVSAVTITDQGDVSAEYLGTEYPCDGATASGSATAGSPAPAPYLVLDTVDIVGCDTVGGLSIDVTATCDLEVYATPGQSVDDALSDHTVAGMLNAGTSGTPCLRGQGGSGLFTCTVDVYGTVPVYLDEDEGSGQQNLTIAGSGLQMRNGSGVCETIPDGTPISLNVDFDVELAAGPVNFVPRGGPLGDLLVDGSPSGTSTVTVTDQGDVAAEWLGTEYPCESATASGTAAAGDVTSGPSLVLDSILVDNCDWTGGLLLDVTELCDVKVSFIPGQTVDTGLVDHAVAGTLNAGTSATPCLRAQGGSGLFSCSLDVYGSVPVTVDEDTDPSGAVQHELTVAGSGLLMRNASGVCGVIPNGTAISLDVDFDLDATAGPLNFIP
jgi:hypothetical protein